MSAPVVGVLALQGGVADHVRMAERAGARTTLVRRPADLDGIDAVILPGGESTTIDKLLRIFDVADPLRDAIAGGLPTLATCAGMILCCTEVIDAAPGQRTLGVLDARVERNSYGSQLASAEVRLDSVLGEVDAAFIRAPRILEVGPHVEIIARRMPHQGGIDDEGDIVAVRSGGIVALSFHPELVNELAFHRDLVSRAG